MIWALFFLLFLYMDTQQGEEASYWPMIVSRLGLALSVISVVISAFKWKQETGERVFPFSREQLKRLGLASFLGYLHSFHRFSGNECGCYDCHWTPV